MQVPFTPSDVPQFVLARLNGALSTSTVIAPEAEFALFVTVNDSGGEV